MSAVFDTWDVDEAARFLQCNADTVRRLAAAGSIPARKPGRRWIFDPDQLRAYVRGEWHSTPRPIVIEVPKPRKRRRLNAVQRKARKRLYRERNRALIASHAAKRKAAELRAMPPWADREAIRCVYDRAALLTKLTGIPHHVDHIVPLRARNACGLHVASNLRVITARENVRRPRDYKGELCF